MAAPKPDDVADAAELEAKHPDMGRFLVELLRTHTPVIADLRAAWGALDA